MAGVADFQLLPVRHDIVGWLGQFRGDVAHGCQSRSIRMSVLSGRFAKAARSEVTSEPGLQLLAFSTAPDSPSEDGLKLLATWAAAQVDTPRADPAATETLDRP